MLLLKQTAQELRCSEAIFKQTSVVFPYLPDDHGASQPFENTSFIEELDRHAEVTRQAGLARSPAAEAEEERLQQQQREELAKLMDPDRQNQLEHIKE